ncbi:DUF3124 domain-containing protein [Patiriisocius sp. Uisw_017]|jgi:hypothetical protein|uniref:DUF3124 domain-containing protein n=1 Tax=Patiriisocius sp. Uisw_017 TaxID=3230968 RepID=UPI0039E91CC7
MQNILFILLFSMAFVSCERPNKTLLQQENARIEPNILEHSFNFPIEEEVYIPIYSDIYCRTRNFKVLLTATLSIRNTSRTEELYVKEVGYYDSAGNFIRNYVEKPIYLNTLETIDFVIDEEDLSGGSGAKFLVTWGSKKPTRPIIQAVMLGHIGQQGVTFTTQGETISQKNELEDKNKADIEK